MKDDKDLFPAGDEEDLFAGLTDKEAAFRSAMSKITTSILSDFLQCKKINQSCSGCGDARLIIPQVQMYRLKTGDPVSHSHAYYSQFMKGDECETNPNCHEYSLICKNCGLTSKINAGIVLEWYNDKEHHNGKSE